jgi:diguanylate cyclase (GGDEF)-like protein
MALGMARLRYPAALGGLAAVLLVLAGFGVVSALRTNQAARRVNVSTQLSDAYQRARVAVGEEESLERKYRLEPGREVLSNYEGAAQELEVALRDIARIGTPADRALAGRLLKVHDRYLQAIDRMFAAVDAGDTKRVLTVDADEVDPRFVAIEGQVSNAATTHRVVASRDLHRLGGVEHSVLTATLLVSAVGLLLLGFLTLLLNGINRQLASQARKSQHNALHDALTGLPNRVLFSDRLEHAIAAASRDPRPLSVLMLDLIRLKEINDTLGHGIGDQLLREVGPRLMPILRSGDSLARLGGDEFAVLLPAAGTAEAKEITGRVLAAMREPFALGELTVTIDANVGIVTYPTHGEDAETLIQRADIAMYLAKGGGRGEALYDPAEDPYDPERLPLIGDLRHAISDGQLFLHYQPKFATDDLRLVGVEALVRWQHPVRGQLPPGDFIALAERTGLIRPLTLEVLRQAARQCHAWNQGGLEVTVAVNLSIANLLDDHLVDDVARVLSDEHLPADRLVLEITEGTVMSDPRRTIAMLGRLAGMGIALSIDDFGTGHASLTRLRRLPVSELKIDQSFVQHLAVDDGDAQVVRSTIDLAHGLGLRVVAEGVEDGKALALLRAYNCDLVQGFHLGHPVPPDMLLDQLPTDASRVPAPAKA